MFWESRWVGFYWPWSGGNRSWVRERTSRNDPSVIPPDPTPSETAFISLTHNTLEECDIPLSCLLPCTQAISNKLGLLSFFSSSVFMSITLKLKNLIFGGPTAAPLMSLSNLQTGQLCQPCLVPWCQLGGWTARAGRLWRFTYLGVCQLLLTVGWDPCWGYCQEHLHVASSQHGSFIARTTALRAAGKPGACHGLFQSYLRSQTESFSVGLIQK